MNRNIIIAIVLLITLIFLLIMIPKELYTTPSTTDLDLLKNIPYNYIDYDTKIHDKWFEREHHIKNYKEKESEILDLSNELSNYLLSEVTHKEIKDGVKDFSKGEFINYDVNLIKVLDKVLKALDKDLIEKYAKENLNNESNYSYQKIMYDLEKRMTGSIKLSEVDAATKLSFAKKHPDYKESNNIYDCDESCHEIIDTLRKFIDLNKQYVELKKPNNVNYIQIKKILINKNKEKYYKYDKYDNDETIYSDLEDYIGEQLLKKTDPNKKITIDKFYDYIILQEPYKLKVLIYFILKKHILEKLDDRFNTIPKLPCVYYSKSNCPNNHCKPNDNGGDNVECMPKNINRPIKYCEVVSKYGKDYCEENYQLIDSNKKYCKYNDTKICSANNSGITTNITANKKKKF